MAVFWTFTARLQRMRGESTEWHDGAV